MQFFPARLSSLPRRGRGPTVGSSSLHALLPAPLHLSSLRPRYLSPFRLFASPRGGVTRSLSAGLPRLRASPLLRTSSYPVDSTGPVAMAAKIDGTAIAKSIREGLKNEIQQIQQTNPRFKPSLVIFQSMCRIRVVRWIRKRAILTRV